MKITHKALIVVACFLSGSAYSQVELKENVRYEGNTHLVIPTLGISFIVPVGFYGGVAPGSPFMVLADDSNEISIIITADEMKEQNVAADMQRQMSIDEGLSISPIGMVKVEGKRWYGDYKVEGATQDMKCYVEVKLGDYNIGVGCIVIALPSAIARAKKAGIDVLKSMTFKAPIQPQVAASSGINQPWNEYFRGKSLKYFYTQGDFSDTDFIHLCSNGSFTRSKSTVSGGSTGTGSMWGGNQGTWQATGKGDEGELILNNRDGTRSQFRIQYRQGTKGLGLYLDGYRYYTEASDQCN